jgi:hypothetical protein
MTFEQKISPEQAENEINALLDRKGVLPKQRERLGPAIEAVVEGMSLGFVDINDDDTIVQRLIKPLPSLTELKYAARIDPARINKQISELRIDTQTNRNLVYITAYTGQVTGTIQKLEGADRNIADSIAFFFQ